MRFDSVRVLKYRSASAGPTVGTTVHRAQPLWFWQIKYVHNAWWWWWSVACGMMAACGLCSGRGTTRRCDAHVQMCVSGVFVFGNIRLKFNRVPLQRGRRRERERREFTRGSLLTEKWVRVVETVWPGWIGLWLCLLRWWWAECAMLMQLLRLLMLLAAHCTHALLRVPYVSHPFTSRAATLSAENYSPPRRARAAAAFAGQMLDKRPAHECPYTGDAMCRRLDKRWHPVVVTSPSLVGRSNTKLCRAECTVRWIGMPCFLLTSFNY